MKHLTYFGLMGAALAIATSACTVEAEPGDFGPHGMPDDVMPDPDDEVPEDEPAATCLDGMQNGMESDVDCGGRCPACDDGLSCDIGDDCLSHNCIHGVCGLPTCDDEQQNQNETDIDCGGKCDPCELGQACEADDDCGSGMCFDGACAQPSCEDGVLNQTETDIDCGGKSCAACLDGGACVTNLDCESEYCAEGTCAPKTCTSHDDCDVLDSTCAVGTCDKDTFVCKAIPINGGQPCQDENLCTVDTVCEAGKCGGGELVDCSDLDGACTVGVCNENDGQCEAEIANEGMPCDDGDACTLAEICDLGTCIDDDGPAIEMWETFADNSAGWSLGSSWQIGPTSVSPTGEVAGKDPAADHSAGGDNGVAGAVLGGLVSGPKDWTYLQSPVVALDAAPGDVELSLWRWLNSDAYSQMPGIIQVFDGAQWVTLWQNADQINTDATWKTESFDVTDYKNANFRLRVGWRATGAASTAAGWNVDDVLIAPPGCQAP